ncbi:MAG TPA: hypothetical protein VH951_07425, partial [Dehalococcoidia bacterium]
MTMIQATDDFKFEWPSPGDAQFVWLWDQMHNPRPLPPMAAEIMTRSMTRVMGGRRLVINGYMYNSFGGPGAMPGPPGPMGAPGGEPPDPWQLWNNANLPRIKKIVDGIRNRDYASMSSARLAHSLDEIITESGEAFLLTFGAVLNGGMNTNMLVDFCEQELGPEGAVRAMTMIQGHDNESASAGAGLSRLAVLAATSPELAAALRENRFDGLEALPGGDAFVRELRAYLDEYGRRAVTWGEIHIPTWAEDPEVPLKLIGRYLADPSRAPEAALKRAQEQRDAAIAETEAQLKPDKLERFRALLKASQIHVPISENRAMWQLISAAVLRVPLLALGGKLVTEGRLSQPDDIFFVTPEEAIELAEGRPLVGIEGLVRQRRADLQHWAALLPPKNLGAHAPPMMVGFLARFFGYGVEQGADAAIVTGIAAAKGVVKAVARVIMDLSDAD